VFKSVIELRGLFTGFLFLLLLKIIPVAAQPGWPEITNENKPWTRWWWLGNAVDKPNLTHNLDALHQAGFGGVELALLTPMKIAVPNNGGIIIDYNGYILSISI
jgi:hypothetical protein